MSVQDYLDQFDQPVQAKLNALRQLIKTESPKAEESMSYGLIGYKLRGKPLVYIGGFKKHIGLYATPNGHEAFRQEFAPYKQGKGSVQFPLDSPLPLELVKKVVQYRNKQIGGV